MEDSPKDPQTSNQQDAITEPATDQTIAQPETPQNIPASVAPETTPATKPAKKLYQKWWFWVIIGLALLFYVQLMNHVDSTMVMHKPILYLYPEQTTEVEVELEHPERITTNYPKYGDGWKVTAQPNGDLTDANGKNYYALYWEESEPEPVDFSKGFYVTKDNAADFLEEKLTEIGLNDRERNEFIMYWLPKLEKNPQNIVHFSLTENLQKHNRINISPAPDSLLRVRIHIKPVDRQPNLTAQTFAKFERRGFAAVEWGGTEH